MTEAYTTPLSNQARLCKLVQEVEGSPGSFPDFNGPCVYKMMPIAISSYEKSEGAAVTLTLSTDPARAIYAVNFRGNTPVLGATYLVIQIKPGVYVFDNQQTFLDFM